MFHMKFYVYNCKDNAVTTLCDGAKMRKGIGHKFRVDEHLYHIILSEYNEFFGTWGYVDLFNTHWERGAQHIPSSQPEGNIVLVWYNGKE